MACADPVVLKDGSNVLVHLAPAPVVARVGGLTAQVRPNIAAMLAKDVALAGWLASVGAPVVAPSAELPVGPHQHLGRTLTFWTYVPHDRSHVWQPAEVGPLLAELHSVLRGYPGELPGVPPLDVPEVITFLRSTGEPLASDADLVLLAERADRINAELSAAGLESLPLHGDTHPGNLLSTPNGPVWTDFEDSWRGPIGWDLACLAGTNRLDGWAAVASYPAAPGRETLSLSLAARQLQSLAWSLVFLWRFRTPERRADVDAGLAALRSGG